MSGHGVLHCPLKARAGRLRELAYRDPRAFPVLLDSSASGSLGRWSILGAYPQGALTLRSDGHLRIEGEVALAARRQGWGGPAAGSGGFLAALQELWREQAAHAEHVGSSPLAALPASPFLGGWMVFLSYEIAAEVEPQLRLPSAAGAVPVALALRIPAAVLFDHDSNQAWALAEPGREDLLRALSETVEQGVAVAAAPGHADLEGLWAAALPPLSLHEEPPELYLRRVTHALEYIRAGDIYQANLSRPWRGRFAIRAGDDRDLGAALYERLRRSNPAPFAGLMQYGSWQLLCSSPERLVRVHEGIVETRPIAGTRSRSRQSGEDARELAALIAHPKERAEHVMLIDLERNDLGRICQPGSVRAEPMMFTESYAHVHHIVSSVTGRLREGFSPIEVLRAVFPGGTITGCPKFRCMQIIAELEAEPRGAYTGALGFINHDGSMDMNILIRSLSLAAGEFELRAGAGIVADSDPQRELEETRAKARGLLAALPPAAYRWS